LTRNVKEILQHCQRINWFRKEKKNKLLLGLEICVFGSEKKTEGDCVFVFCFVFVWKFVQNWMPTKDNLVNRRIIGEDSQLCCAGFDSIESGVYIVFECSAFTWVGSSKMVGSGGLYIGRG
jgi:hypothetical protein